MLMITCIVDHADEVLTKRQREQILDERVGVNLRYLHATDRTAARLAQWRDAARLVAQVQSRAVGADHARHR